MMLGNVTNLALSRSADVGRQRPKYNACESCAGFRSASFASEIIGRISLRGLLGGVEFSPSFPSHVCSPTLPPRCDTRETRHVKVKDCLVLDNPSTVVELPPPDQGFCRPLLSHSQTTSSNHPENKTTVELRVGNRAGRPMRHGGVLCMAIVLVLLHSCITENVNRPP